MISTSAGTGNRTGVYSMRGTIADIKRDVGYVKSSIVKRATARAMNRTMTHIVKIATRSVAARHNIPQRPIKRRTKRLPATIRKQSTTVRVLTRPIPAASLSRDGGGVTRAIQTAQGVRAGRTSTAHAFLAIPGGGKAKTASGAATSPHAHVFVRKGKERRPMKMVKIEVKSDIESAYTLGLQLGRGYFARVFEHELRFRLAKPRRV